MHIQNLSPSPKNIYFYILNILPSNSYLKLFYLYLSAVTNNPKWRFRYV